MRDLIRIEGIPFNLMKYSRFFLSAVGLALGLAADAGWAAFPTVALKPVVLQQIHSPTTITFAPDGSGRVFVCDQPGKIYIIDRGMLLPVPFLNIANPGNAAPNQGPGPVISVGTGYSERGLLGLAFHPGYDNPASPGYRKFYVNYNKAAGAGDPSPPQVGDPVNCVTVIDEFEVSADNPNLANIASQRRVLAFTQPQGNHNGGQLEFGPDGLLYIGTGDGGGAQDNNAGHTGGAASPRPTNNLGNGLDLTRFLGKILRIDPVDPDGAGSATYGIPGTNPFVGAGGGVKEEIYAYGLRNPWRFSFDKRAGGTNRLFCGDVGQGRVEEINIITAGGNYGWRYKEGLEFPDFSSGSGTSPMPDPGSGPYIDPIAMYAHPGAVTNPVLPQLGLSVTGGFVYRGAEIPGMQGKYLFGDYGSTGGASDGRIMGLEETAPGSGVFTLTQAVPLFGLANPIVGQRILTLGEDESGEIYVGLRSTTGVLLLDGGLPAGGIYKVIPVASETANLIPQQDNTIFSEDAAVSDGRGYLYAGRTGPNFGPYNRRALIAFDPASNLPTGAQIQSAALKLNLNRVGPAGDGTTLALHRLTETWGEGTSKNASGGTGAPATANDATWTQRFYNTTPWTTAGGVFVPGSSATTAAAFGIVTFSSPQMITDVQGWLDTPASNAGWIILGDEVTETSANRFDSKNLGSVAPKLELSYLAITEQPTPLEGWLALNFPELLVGQYLDPNGDVENDGIKNLLEYAFGLDPKLRESGANFGASQVPAATTGTDIILTFRRNVDATDLRFRLQISSDLIDWSTTIAESVDGNEASALNGAEIVSEEFLDGSANLVTVKLHFPAGLTGPVFSRVQVDWP